MRGNQFSNKRAPYVHVLGYWADFDSTVTDLPIIFWYYANHLYIINKSIGGKLSWYNFDCILCYSNYDKISNLI